MSTGPRRDSSVRPSGNAQRSRLGDVDFASAAAVGRRGNDVLRGGLLGRRRRVQVVGLGLGLGLGRALRSRLLRLQVSLTLRDDKVCLRDK